MRSTREPSSSTLRRRGVLAVALVMLVAVAIAVNPFAGSDDTAEFAIRAPSLPDGVQAGTPVDIRGETVGTVCGLDLSRADQTEVTLCVRREALGELTNATEVSFASRNLFGSDALRLTPTGTGTALSDGGVITLAQAPANNTMTAAVRSAGGFTLPVLTPELSELLKQVSETTIRLAPFLTAATVTMQTLQRGQSVRLSTLLPVAADAVDGIAEAGAGAVTSLETILTNPLLADHGYTARVESMIGDIGDLFGGLGTLFNGMAGLGGALDLVTAFTTPLTTSLAGVDPARLGRLIDRLDGALRVGPDGKTTLAVSVDLNIVPGIATGLTTMLRPKAAR